MSVLQTNVGPTRDLAVVHLVRAANDRSAFTRFMDAYERLDAGVDHRLVLLMKGYCDTGQAAAVLERAAAHQPGIVAVGDEGVDITAYLAAARALADRYVCLLNSFAEPLHANWLRELAEPVMAGSASAAGASGSWGSHLGYSLWQLGAHGGYGGAGPSRRESRLAFHELADAHYGGDVGHWLLSAWNALRFAAAGRRFPAPHLRTNAFVVDRAAWLALGVSPPKTKLEAYAAESGRRSVTRRWQQAGPAPVVVDRTGAVREPNDWASGDVFWQGRQGDLLVADNQTRMYDAATELQRAVLRAYAWGGEAWSPDV